MTALRWRAMTADPNGAHPFGALLRAARGRMTRDTLARRAKISVRSLAAYEAGETTPKIEVAARLAVVLGVRLDELAGINHRESPPRPREVVLLIDGEPWTAHVERRMEVRAQWGEAVQAVQAFSAGLDPKAPQRDRRRDTR